MLSRHRKELRGALGHGLCVNPSLLKWRPESGCCTSLIPDIDTPVKPKRCQVLGVSPNL